MNKRRNQRIQIELGLLDVDDIFKPKAKCTTDDTGTKSKRKKRWGSLRAGQREPRLGASTPETSLKLALTWLFALQVLPLLRLMAFQLHSPSGSSNYSLIVNHPNRAEWPGWMPAAVEALLTFNPIPLNGTIQSWGGMIVRGTRDRLSWRTG